MVEAAGPASGAPLALVLHGALGAGQNFRRFVQRLCERRPDYRYVLVDLRSHGESTGAPPPHTLAACGQDLVTLVGQLEGVARVVIGHSFGGKVALQYASRAPVGLRQVWALDSLPGAQRPTASTEIVRVIEAVRSLSTPAPGRAEALRHLVEGVGLPKGLAQWLATNLVRGPQGYEWKFDIDAIEELMNDYFRADLWPYLESAKGAVSVELVVAEGSDRWTGDTRARAERIGPEAAVRCRVLADSGHWVHVDNPDALLEMMAEGLVPARG